MERVDDLLAQAKLGDAAALNALLAEYRPLLRFIAQQQGAAALRPRADASDVVQLTQLEACRALPAFRGQTAAEFTAWIKQILRHNAANLGREQRAARRDVRRESSHSADWLASGWAPRPAVEASPANQAINDETAHALADAMLELPALQREAVHMRHVEGRRIDQIAQAMDRSGPAVAGLLRRGLDTLRRKLSSYCGRS
jgi:RNA polymerase sigma-70 factor (ECF subfamily)